MKSFITVSLALVSGLVLVACGSPSPYSMSDLNVGSGDNKPATEKVVECPGGDKDGDGRCARDGEDKVLDCDDGDATVHRDAEEVCDGVDNDCNGETDEGFALVTYYLDEDGDSWGDENRPLGACVGSIPVGYAEKKGDCNDSPTSGKNTHPEAKDETLDGLDQDCDDVDGQKPPAPEPVEEKPTAKPGSLSLKTNKEDRLELSYHFFSIASDVGGHWDDDPVVLTLGNNVSTSFSDMGSACGVRLSLQIGGGDDATWSCSGSGSDAKMSELVTGLELKVGEKTMTLDDVEIWSDPSGDGCSLVLTWGDACSL